MINRPTLYYDPRGMASRMALLILAETARSCRKVAMRGVVRPNFACISPSLCLPVYVAGDQRLTRLHEIGAAPDIASGDANHWLVSSETYPDALLAATLAAPWSRSFRRLGLRRLIRIAGNYAAEHQELAPVYEARIREYRETTAALSDATQAQERLRRLDALFDRFESHIAGRAYAAGDGWSYVDAIWTVFIARIRKLGLSDIVSRARRPATSVYYRSMRARPSFRVAGLRDGAPTSFATPPQSSAGPAGFTPSKFTQRSMS